MRELGSKISLISEADIRFEGHEISIVLASMRYFGTEDGETQYPLASQSPMSINDILVENNIQLPPYDPAIIQTLVLPTLCCDATTWQFMEQFTVGSGGQVVGQLQSPQYHPIAGFPGGVHTQLNEISSMLNLIGGGPQNASRSGTPIAGDHRKSPTADKGTQHVGFVAGGSGQQRDNCRGSNGAPGQKQPNRNQTNTHNHHRYPSGGPSAPKHGQHHYFQPGQGYRGGWQGRGQGRRRVFVPHNKNTLKFDIDYDFELANTKFEELRSQLAKIKISDGDVKGAVKKLDDTDNETGAGEAEQDDEFSGYDKTKSFFDNISCESGQAWKRRFQRTDWRTERKLNSETFGAGMARTAAWRCRLHKPMNYFSSWPPIRGGRPGWPGMHPQNQYYGQPRANPPAVAAAPGQPQPRANPPAAPAAPTQPLPQRATADAE